MVGLIFPRQKRNLRMRFGLLPPATRARHPKQTSNCARRTTSGAFFRNGRRPPKMHFGERFKDFQASSLHSLRDTHQRRSKPIRAFTLTA